MMSEDILRIVSLDSLAYLELTLGECDDPVDPSVCLGVDVSCHAFKGCDERVYFSLNAVDRFLQEIRRFDETRSGTATLVSFGAEAGSEQDGCRLEFYTTDGWGYPAVRIDLIKFSYRVCGDTGVPLRVGVSFDIDPGELGRIATQFEAIFRCLNRYRDASQVTDKSTEATPLPTSLDRRGCLGALFSRH